METSTQKILEIRDLRIRYHTDNGIVHAVNGVSLSVDPGETLGLVGETGAGKTTTALGILRLLPDQVGRLEGGSIFFDGQDMGSLNDEELRKKRGNELSMIFQDPMTALNPVLTVGDQIGEVIRVHQDISPGRAMELAGEMLELVGIPAARLYEYPHQFSGGMKQRVVIAIALACRPKLLIADEPTTALDVTIQAQVLEMISKLKAEINTAMLLITHDLGVVAHTCDRVAIMYAGEIVEYGSLEQVFDAPAHPYTLGLFGSIPDISRELRRLTPIEGLMPDPFNLPRGCVFAERCRFAAGRCGEEKPPELDIGGGHRTRCLFPVRAGGSAPAGGN
ncbi:MAG: ABC transporter ATP-binding protein [Treponema sp.]|jgi:peptide/nickel transport system ATP-binding protein|nr:ABC transporter ATP-binding protein [Treponema sp.]